MLVLAIWAPFVLRTFPPRVGETPPPSPGIPRSRSACSRPFRSAKGARWDSMRSTWSGGALPPAWDLTLNPLYSGGLWLAVIITPQAALWVVTA